MRNTVLIFLLLLLPVMVMAQERKDYKAVVAQFMESYNANDANGINNLFSARSHERGSYTRGKIAALKNKLRDMRSFSYVRQREDGLVIFRVKFAKYTGKYPGLYGDNSNSWIGLTLDHDNKIMRLRFPTYANPSNAPRYIMKF